jgi:NADH-quinone oxidoreductase subunit F
MSTIGMLGDLEISIVEGPEEYLFGEEKALLEVIEGRDPCRRCCRRGSAAVRDDPARVDADVSTGQAGRSNPTVVDNVETLAAARTSSRRARPGFVRWHPESPGTVIVTIVGTCSAAECSKSNAARHSAPCSTSAEGRPGRQLVAAFSGVSNLGPAG